jgi:hypothetical protein
MERVLTHALHNPGDALEPTPEPAATVPMDPEQEEPNAEPATPGYPIYNKDAFTYNNNSLFFRFRVQVLVFFIFIYLGLRV